MNAETSGAAARLGRFLPLAGVLFAGLTIAVYTAMGHLPDTAAPASRLTAFYSAHHGRVATTGILLAWAAVSFAFFGAAVWARLRRTAPHPLFAGAALLGTAVAAAGQLYGASIYLTLGDIGGEHATLPATLQVWHTAGSAVVPGGGGAAILLLAVAAAGILGRAFPRSLAWPALAIGVLQLTPLDFLAWILFLLWAAVAGVVMVVRPADAAPATVEPRSTALAT